MTERPNIQSEVATWKSGFLPVDRTVREEFVRMTQEVDELDKATVVFDGSQEAREAVRTEMADVFIGLLGMAVILGVDLEKEAHEKMMLTRNKYPPQVITRLLGQGVGFDQAMQMQKTAEENRTPHQKRWDKRLLR